MYWYRKKNIFKLAQGEYIAPEKIENVYAKCKFIAQCFIYGKTMRFDNFLLSFLFRCWHLIVLIGDILNSSLVAIVSVDQDVLKAWAATEGIKVIYVPVFYVAAISRIIFDMSMFLFFGTVFIFSSPIWCNVYGY